MMIKTLLSLFPTLSAFQFQSPLNKTSLQDLVNRAAKTTIERFADKKLTEDQLSITLIDHARSEASGHREFSR